MIKIIDFGLSIKNEIKVIKILYKLNKSIIGVELQGTWLQKSFKINQKLVNGHQIQISSVLE